MTGLGFDVLAGDHPIVPVMLGDAALAARMAELLLQKGRLCDRVQLPGGPDGQGAHPHPDVGRTHRDDLERAATAFDEARAELA